MYQLKYLLQRDFSFFKPYLHFCNFVIRRKNSYEMGEEENAYSNPLLNILSKYNVFLMFMFVKYCQWYFSQSNVNQSSNREGDGVCPPPKQRQKYAKSWKICGKTKIENPCALETTGYVYCFACIQEHTEENQKAAIRMVRGS